MIVFTRKIDEYSNFLFGKLEYRRLEFEHQTLDVPNYQGNEVVNYTEVKVSFTRTKNTSILNLESNLKH